MTTRLATLTCGGWQVIRAFARGRGFATHGTAVVAQPRCNLCNIGKVVWPHTLAKCLRMIEMLADVACWQAPSAGPGSDTLTCRMTAMPMPTMPASLSWAVVLPPCIPVQVKAHSVGGLAPLGIPDAGPVMVDGYGRPDAHTRSSRCLANPYPTTWRTGTSASPLW